MAGELRLGLNLGYWGGGPPPGAQESVREADDSALTRCGPPRPTGRTRSCPWPGGGEHRADQAGHGDRPDLGPHARRDRHGGDDPRPPERRTGDPRVGVSGPQVVEGWYGQPFAKPLARMREYIAILRDIWARGGPVSNDGPHYPLPCPTERAWASR